MLQKIKNEGLSIDSVIEKAKSKDEPFRLFGFGHRVYKTFDPRAKIAKELSAYAATSPAEYVAEGFAECMSSGAPRRAARAVAEAIAKSYQTLEASR